MADNKTWGELLRDPRWQRKRLEIMERDEFRCQRCGATDKTLNVHHGYYAKNTTPWDYDDWTLHTVCDDCHEDAERDRVELKRMLGSLNAAGIARVEGYILAIVAYNDGSKSSEITVDERTATGVADFLGMAVRDLERHLTAQKTISCLKMRLLKNAAWDKEMTATPDAAGSLEHIGV